MLRSLSSTACRTPVPAPRAAEGAPLAPVVELASRRPRPLPDPGALHITPELLAALASTVDAPRDLFGRR